LSESDKLLKDLKGLKNDVTAVAGQLAKQSEMESLFGSSGSMSNYYHNLDMINRVRASKEKYDNAVKYITDKNGMNDYVTTTDGRVVVTDSERNL